MSSLKAASDLCTWARELVQLGIASDENGCLSIRSGDTILMTPENKNLSELEAEDIATIDIKTCAPKDGPKPDSRFALHVALYKKRKKTSALLHAESLSIKTSSRAGIEVPPLLDDMAQIVGVTAKVAHGWPYRGAAPVVSAMKGRDAVLLKNSGALCGGPSMDDAVAVAQVLEKGCKAFIETSFLGGGVKINAAESLLMRTVYKLKYSKQDTTNA